MTTYTHSDGSTSTVVKTGPNTHSVTHSDTTVGRVRVIPTTSGREIRYRTSGEVAWVYAPSFIHAVGYLVGSPVVKTED